MIGEIRDLETAQIAVQASLTGHLVLATLHTNDAASAMTRLADMGVEPYLLASSLLGVLGAAAGAQALPRVPRRASRRRPAKPQLLARSRRCRATLALYAPAGCARVQRHGLPRPLRRLRAHRRRRCDAPADPRSRAGARAARGARCAAGTTSLRRDGARWLADGTTSLAELVRVSREDLTVELPRMCARSATRPSTRRASSRAGWSMPRSARQVRDRLRGEGLFPRRSIRKAMPRRSAERTTSATQRLRLPAAQVALSTRQLATLVRSGMPLDQALSAVARAGRRCRAPPRSSPRRARRSRAGEPLWRRARALAADVLRALSRSRRGRRRKPAVSPTCSTRLADYLEARQAQRQQFTLALVYPALVTVIALAVIVGAAGLRRAADRVGVPAEPADAAVAHAGADRAVSGFLRGDRHGSGSLASPRRRSRSLLANRREAFRARWQRRCCARPSSGRLVVAVDTARFASTLAILTGSGAPLLRSLDAARDVVWALPLRGGGRQRRRCSCAKACRSRARLKEQRVFPPVLIHLTANGEASGQLAPMLRARRRRAGTRGRAPHQLVRGAAAAGADRRPWARSCWSWCWR